MSHYGYNTFAPGGSGYKRAEALARAAVENGVKSLRCRASLWCPAGHYYDGVDIPVLNEKQVLSAILSWERPIVAIQRGEEQLAAIEGKP